MRRPHKPKPAILLDARKEIQKSRPMLVASGFAFSSVTEVAEAVLDALDAQKPFSLIRLGDGEAVVLGYPDLIHPARFAHWMGNFFGPHAQPAHGFDALRASLARAIRNADVVGLCRRKWADPDDARARLSQLGAKGGRLTQPEKEAISAVEWGVLAYLAAPLLAPGQILITTGVHGDLEKSGVLLQCVSRAAQVNLISGNDLEALFAARFPDKILRVRRVPTEYKFATDARDGWEGRPPHFPDVFEALLEEIRRGDFAGLSLVGAGPCGKVYCDAIRAAGGVALDVGSIMDLWAGRRTRSYLAGMQSVTL